MNSTDGGGLTLKHERESAVLIVAGFLIVEPSERDSYLAGCRSVVQQARVARGCLDYAITADLADPGRIDIFERWESRAAVEDFRGDGPSGEQQGAIVSASVCEYDVTNEKRLT
jgi:quinol monooxygenase YgiN